MEYEDFKEYVLALVRCSTDQTIDMAEFDTWLKPYHQNLSISRMSDMAVAQEYLAYLKKKQADVA